LPFFEIVVPAPRCILKGDGEALAAVQERWDWSQFNSCLEDMSHLEDTELEYRRRNFTAEKERTRDV
jgi:hypothetical protein